MKDIETHDDDDDDNDDDDDDNNAIDIDGGGGSISFGCAKPHTLMQHPKVTYK
jgi:hypothetical protein